MGGNIVVVTGGSSGNGRAGVVQALEAGWRVVNLSPYFRTSPLHKKIKERSFPPFPDNVIAPISTPKLAIPSMIGTE